MISIKYFDKFSVKNNNIVIFITKFTELSKISLPIDLPINLKDKDYQKTLDSNKYLELLCFDQKSKLNYKIIIKQISTTDKTLLSSGGSVYGLFDYKISKNITFIFSNYFKNKDLISDIILGFKIRSYNFDKYLSKKNSNPEILFIKNVSKKISNKINYNLNLLKAINFAKDLVSEPANILNPETYSKLCQKIKIKGLKIKILNKNQLSKLGFESLISVSNGSEIEPRVVVFEWNLNKRKKPITLLGKGVTFDTGGISLKPANGMEEMIMDMGGSAVVVGTMINAALNKSKASLVGVIGLVENMPDGKSTRPGDIIGSLSGQTIEVFNTDAEGRLVLADLISYVTNNYKPAQIIDFATLTGAIMIALGTHKAGLFSNNDKLSKKIELAGSSSQEHVWRMPLGKEYDLEIDSKRADMKNIGSTRYGGSTQAAQFLQRFVKKDIPWAHIDIAGVTWSNKQLNNIHQPGATAFGVRLMDAFLKGI